MIGGEEKGRNEPRLVVEDPLVPGRNLCAGSHKVGLLKERLDTTLETTS